MVNHLSDDNKKPLNFNNTSKVKDMSKMFLSATNFNQSLNFNNTSKVENMSAMFYNAINFNNGDQPLELILLH